LDNGDDTLLFDWYCPFGEGPFPVIITIHGGAWVIGNKGFSNIPLFNHYFASKGYAVFDIQYGLFDPTTLSGGQQNVFDSFANLGLDIFPQYNRSYTMEDQIENVGYFTKVLELNSSKYKADIDHVFVVGRSAGGHLASLVTLGYRNPLYEGNFSANMNVEGGIWFYPVTNVTRHTSSLFDALIEGDLPIDDQYTKLFAANLITNSSVVPPIMIIHGSKDGLADYETQGLSFYEYALSLGEKCILVTIPWAGHGFDYDFNGFGGQISTYYVERFMALELLED
jgi:acetyl esterase/lipase